MKTILIPTDFSAAAKNAENFAALLSADVTGCRLVLLNAYDKQGYGSDGTPIQLNAEAEKNIAEAALYNHRNAMLAQNPAASIDILALPGPLPSVMPGAIAQTGATMLIMGMNHLAGLDKVLLGSATLGLLRTASLPVLIVPEDVPYQPLKNIVFATDLQDAGNSTPAAFLNELVQHFTSRLDVVHVGQHNNSDTLNEMAGLLKPSAPVFHFLQDEGFAETLNGFIEREQVHALVLVTRKHDFFERVFKASHTKTMAYKAAVPVIAVPEAYCRK